MSPRIPRIEHHSEVARWRLAVNGMFETEKLVNGPITGDTVIVPLPNNPFPEFFPVDASAGHVVMTLPDAAKYKGKMLIFQKIDLTNNYVRIQAQGTDDVNEDPYFDLLMQYESVNPISIGTGWLI
ncbi:MAG: hypothetical protein GY800_09035 [Planctomycetes bacterium]|nr:hypothetical protein [Planctomycetota bacterium]